MSDDNHQTRLYLTLPPVAPDQLELIGGLLERLTSKLDIACVNLALKEQGGPQSSQEEQQQLKALIVNLQNKNIAVLAELAAPQYGINRKSFEKALENAHILGCDGAHLSADATLFKRAREVLGADAIIGVDCGASRHAAMQLGELGADYIGFSSVDAASSHEGQDHDLNIGNVENTAEAFAPETRIDLVDWWQQLFEVPCVALDVADRSQIEGLLKINADFVAIGPNLWPAFSSDDELMTWLATICPISQAGS